VRHRQPGALGQVGEVRRFSAGDLRCSQPLAEGEPNVTSILSPNMPSFNRRRRIGPNDFTRVDDPS
jgi:hypothetical protein